MSSNSFLSAVVVIPPEDIWPPIQAIRKQYDKAYNTWMPHINLLFPFLENDSAGINFGQAAQYLSKHLPNEMRSFQVKFTKESIRYFDHGGKCSVHLRPLMVDTAGERSKRSELENISKQNLASEKRRKSQNSDKPAARKTRWGQEQNVPEGGNGRWRPGPKEPENQVQAVASNPPRPVVKSTVKSAWSVNQAERPTLCSSHPSAGHVDSAMKESFQIVQIKPIPPIPPEFRNLPTPSISSLKDAVWTGSDFWERTGTVPEVGLGCLRYANWSPENITETFTGQGKRSECEVIQSVKVSIDAHPAQSPGSNVNKISQDPLTVYSSSSSSSSSSDDDDDDDVDDVAVTSHRRRHKKTNPTKPSTAPVPDPSKSVHKNLKHLQSKLESLYPQFNEQSSKSAAGFQPHLTLGQVETRKVNKFVAELKLDWKDVTFDVSEVHLISRQGRVAHEIYESVQLGD